MQYRSLGFTLSLLGTLLFSCTLLFWSQLVLAQTFSNAIPLEGYLWAGTQDVLGGGTQGVGWISLNCANEATCANDYKVEIIPETDPNTAEVATVEGYAWAGGNTGPGGTDAAFGWIRFGGLTGCPAGICDARVVGSDSGSLISNQFSGYELTGWARACAVFQSGCSGALKPNVERGGWDGWISLNCENTSGCGTSNYAARINNNGQFSSNSMGWGSDVMGRVYFSFSKFAPACTTEASCNVDYTASTYTNLWCEDTVTTCATGTICNPATGTCDGTSALSGTITFTPAIVRSGAQAQADWTVTGSFDDCWLENGSGAQVDNPGEYTPAAGRNATIYTLYCVPTGGTNPIEVTSEQLDVVPAIQET